LADVFTNEILILASDYVYFLIKLVISSVFSKTEKNGSVTEMDTARRRYWTRLVE